MEVHEAYLALQNLMSQGKGKCELIFRDSRSGDTGSVSIQGKTETITEQEDMGRLCDEEIGFEYVPVYTDH